MSINHKYYPAVLWLFVLAMPWWGFGQNIKKDSIKASTNSIAIGASFVAGFSLAVILVKYRQFSTGKIKTTLFRGDSFFNS